MEKQKPGINSPGPGGHFTEGSQDHNPGINSPGSGDHLSGGKNFHHSGINAPDYASHRPGFNPVLGFNSPSQYEPPFQQQPTPQDVMIVQLLQQLQQQQSCTIQLLQQQQGPTTNQSFLTQQINQCIQLQQQHLGTVAELMGIRGPVEMIAEQQEQQLHQRLHLQSSETVNIISAHVGNETAETVGFNQQQRSVTTASANANVSNVPIGGFLVGGLGSSNCAPILSTILQHSPTVFGDGQFNNSNNQHLNEFLRSLQISSTSEEIDITDKSVAGDPIILSPVIPVMRQVLAKQIQQGEGSVKRASVTFLLTYRTKPNINAPEIKTAVIIMYAQPIRAFQGSQRTPRQRPKQLIFTKVPANSTWTWEPGGVIVMYSVINQLCQCFPSQPTTYTPLRCLLRYPVDNIQLIHQQHLWTMSLHTIQLHPIISS